MLEEDKKKALTEKFEKDGEEKVAVDLATGIYGNPGDPSYPKACYAKIWLAQKKSQREESIKKQEVLLSKESNEIAKESNSIAKSAKRAAWWAFFISIISIVISLINFSSCRQGH